MRGMKERKRAMSRPLQARIKIIIEAGSALVAGEHALRGQPGNADEFGQFADIERAAGRFGQQRQRFADTVVGTQLQFTAKAQNQHIEGLGLAQLHGGRHDAIVGLQRLALKAQYLPFADHAAGHVVGLAQGFQRSGKA